MSVLNADNGMVGMDSRVKELESYLDRALHEVRTVGIWGTRGIGRTTLAEQVFRRIRHDFEASCFVTDVRGSKGKELVDLQKQLYQDLLGSKADALRSVGTGVGILKQRFCSKKVLIVLDDVHNEEQIEYLVGKAEEQYLWFGSGSRIIVTTRDKHLLKRYGENNIYEVEKLSDDEALRLLCQGAFKQDCPEDYKDPSNSFVQYASGLPLALKVLGGLLHGRDKNQWSDELKRLESSPDERIHSSIRLSYDKDKHMFLDIACFFKGEDESRVKKIFECCDFNPTIGLNILVERALMTTKGGKLWMHDLIQQTGWEIVLQRERLQIKLWESQQVVPA